MIYKIQIKALNQQKQWNPSKNRHFALKNRHFALNLRRAL